MNLQSMILEELNKRVYGHLEAKKALILLLTNSLLVHKAKWVECRDESELPEPMKILLMGESGTGKTHLVESLSRIIPFPLVKIDATKLSPTGAGDGINSDKFEKLIRSTAKKTMEYNPLGFPTLQGTIDRTVVFIDEMDKLGVSFESSGNWNRHTQSNFLTLLDNKEDFKHVSFVFAGAFSHRHRGNKSNIGFKKELLEQQMMDEYLIQSGLIPEIVGRINTICDLDKLEREDYKKILMNILIPLKEKELELYKIDELSIGEDLLNEIIDKTIKSGQGVRFLKRELTKLCMEKEFDAPVDIRLFM